MINPNGIKPAVLFYKVGNSLRPKTSEAVHMMLLNSLQKRKFRINKHDDIPTKGKVVDKSSCMFSTGTKHPDRRVQPTQQQKKLRKLLKQYYND